MTVSEKSAGQVIDDVQVPVHGQHTKGSVAEADSRRKCLFPGSVRVEVGEGPAERPGQRVVRQGQDLAMARASVDHRRGPDDPFASVSQHLERAVAAVVEGLQPDGDVAGVGETDVDRRRPQPGEQPTGEQLPWAGPCRAPRWMRPPRRRDGRADCRRARPAARATVPAAPRTGRRRSGVGPGRSVRPSVSIAPVSRLSTTTASATGRRQSETSGRVEGYQITRGRSDRVKGSMIESRCSQPLARTSRAISSKLTA